MNYLICDFPANFQNEAECLRGGEGREGEGKGREGKGRGGEGEGEGGCTLPLPFIL